MHEIFVLDAHLAKEPDVQDSHSVTRRLVDRLMVALRMEELGPLTIYPALDQRAPGWSFIQPITTSHMAGHYFEKPGRGPHIRFDVYSCVSFNWMHVIEVLHEELGLLDWRATFIERDIEREKQRRIIDIA